jgi:hypothetical protein
MSKEMHQLREDLRINRPHDPDTTRRRLPMQHGEAPVSKDPDTIQRSDKDDEPEE